MARRTVMDLLHQAASTSMKVRHGDQFNDSSVADSGQPCRTSGAQRVLHGFGSRKLDAMISCTSSRSTASQGVVTRQHPCRPADRAPAAGEGPRPHQALLSRGGGHPWPSGCVYHHKLSETAVTRFVDIISARSSSATTLQFFAGGDSLRPACPATMLLNAASNCCK